MAASDLVCSARRFGHIVITAMLLSASTVSAQQRQPIDGRKHPELIPPEVAWESFFRHVVHSVFIDEQGQQHHDPIPEALEGYARLTLSIPSSDAAVLATVARDALDRVAEIRKPLNHEHEGKVHLAWGPGRRLAQVARSFAEVEKAQALLRSRIPPSSFRALERYVRETIVPGMTYMP